MVEAERCTQVYSIQVVVNENCQPDMMCDSAFYSSLIIQNSMRRVCVCVCVWARESDDFAPKNAIKIA